LDSDILTHFFWLTFNSPH